jgi:biopolymer transport protein ExbB
MSEFADFWRSFIPGWGSRIGFLFMWVLGLFTAFIAVLSIERYIYIFHKSNLNAPKFMALIRKYIQAKEIKRAMALCQSLKDKALAQIVLAGLTKASRMQTPTFRAIQNAVDESTLEVIPKLQNRTGYLNMSANVSTLIGLMGTIYGLIVAFQQVSSTAIDAAEKSTMLAYGIAIAMNTTFHGLFNAIPALVIYTILHNKTNRIIDEIDEHTVKLINLLTEEE